MPLPAGRYCISNVQRKNIIVLPNGNERSEIVGHVKDLEDEEYGDQWDVFCLPRDRYKIRNVLYELYFGCNSQSECGEYVVGKSRPQEWYIIWEHGDTLNSHTLRPSADSNLYCSLEFANHGTPVSLSSAHHTNRRNQWRFIPRSSTPLASLAIQLPACDDDERPTSDEESLNGWDSEVVTEPSIEPEDWDGLSAPSALLTSTASIISSFCTLPSAWTEIMASLSEDSQLRKSLSRIKQRDDAESHAFALIVGIDKYQSSSVPQLQGAVNDARHMSRLLRAVFQVPESQISLLCDHEATYRRIVDELLFLAVNPHIQQGDAIIIYFSGHGYQIPALPGCPTGDGLVTAVRPVDEGILKGDSIVPGIHLRDLVQFVHELAEAKGGNITIIFDCCCAGELASTFYSETQTAPFLVTPRQGSGHTSPSNNSGYVILAACQSDEMARETLSKEGRPCGAFSNSLFRHLEWSSPETTYADIIRYTTRDLRYIKQRPIGLGINLGRALFNRKTIGIRRNPKLVYLTEGQDGTYILDAGAVHGIFPGSRFSIRTPNYKDYVYKEIGVLEVQTVHVESSDLIFVGDTSFAIPPCVRAGVLWWGQSDYCLDIYPDGVPAEWMQFTPDHHPRYGTATSRSSGTLSIRPVDGNRMAFDQGYPISAYIKTPILPYIVSTPQMLQQTPNPMSDFHFHLVRRNPIVPKLLKDKVRLSLHEREGPGNDDPDLFSDRHAVVRPGASYGFKIFSISKRGLFPYLFFFDASDHSIQKWYDPGIFGVAPPLPPGTDLNPSCLCVGFPSDLFGPFGFAIPTGAKTGVGFLKLFLCTTHVDMDCLIQDSPFLPSSGTSRGEMPKTSRETWDAQFYVVTVSTDDGAQG